MSSATTFSLKGGRLLGGVRSCWVGVDIGTYSVKVAEVVQESGSWRVVSKANVVLREKKVFEGREYVDGALVGLLRRLIPSQSRFRRCKTACILPMSAMELRSFDLPAVSDDELREIVQQEISAGADDTADVELDVWQNGNNAPHQEDMLNVSALMVPRRVAAAVGRDFVSAGLHCEVLDGLPFALARAVQMAEVHTVETPSAAVDWGFTSAFFTLVDQGRPVYSRSFHDCGVGRLVDAVSQGLGLSFTEAEQLLSSYGSQQMSTALATSEIRRAMAQFAAGPLRQVANEINKTLAYLQQQPNMNPQRIWLFGGGATFADALAESVGMDVTAWCLPTHDGARQQAPDRTQALYGPAIALSALAGEQ